jgi:integrase/recombinase XerD
MKIDRHGQAKILTQAEIQLLFSQGLQNNRDHEKPSLSSDL